MQIILTVSIRIEAFHPALDSPPNWTEMLFISNTYRAQCLLVTWLTEFCSAYVDTVVFKLNELEDHSDLKHRWCRTKLGNTRYIANGTVWVAQVCNGEGSSSKATYYDTSRTWLGTKPRKVHDTDWTENKHGRTGLLPACLSEGPRSLQRLVR